MADPLSVSASRAGRLPTGLRPPATGSVSNVTRIAINKTARPSSRGFFSQAAVGSAVESDINISARPMTGQGMQGVSMKSGRKVYDLNFFQAELLNRNKLISEEIMKLEAMTARINDGNAQAVKLSKERDVLRKKVVELQGLSYDYLSVKKRLSKNETLKSFEETYFRAEAKRKKVRGMADQAFKDRANAENELKAATEQSNKSREDVEAALKGIGEEKSAEIHKLANHNAELIQQSKDMRNELQTLINQASAAQWGARFDRHKRKIVNLYSEFIVLEKRRRELEKTLKEQTALDTTPHLVASLHEKIDMEQHNLEELVQEIKDLQVRLKTETSLIKDAERDDIIILTEVQKQNLEKLIKLEKFQNTYSPKLREIEMSLEVAKKHVLALLVRIQRKSSNTRQGEEENQKNIDQRLAQRAVELQKITDLTKKVNTEISELEIRISDTKAKIDEFLEIEKDKEHIPISKLKEETEELRQSAENLKQKLDDENKRRAEAEMELEKPSHKQLEAKVAEVAKMGSKFFAFEEINQKKLEESNYETEKQRALSLVGALQRSLLE